MSSRTGPPRGVHVVPDLHGVHILVRSPPSIWVIQLVLFYSFLISISLMTGSSRDLLTWALLPASWLAWVGATSLVIVPVTLALYLRELDLLVEGSQLTRRYRIFGFPIGVPRTDDLHGATVRVTGDVLILETNDPVFLRLTKDTAPWVAEQLRHAARLSLEEEAAPVPEALRALTRRPEHLREDR